MPARMQNKGNLLLMGKQNGTATLEDSWQFLTQPHDSYHMTQQFFC